MRVSVWEEGPYDGEEGLSFSFLLCCMSLPFILVLYCEALGLHCIAVCMEIAI